MCFQKFTQCRYNLCNNAVHILDFVECPRKPYCETEFVRIPLKKDSDRFHCEDCANKSQRERNLLYKNRHVQKRLEQTQRSQDTRKSPNKASEDERSDPNPTVTAMLREQINAAQSLPPQRAAIVPANNRSDESENEKMNVALELLALAQQIGMASNESQNEGAIALTNNQSDESDQKKKRAALTLLALAEEIGMTPNLPQSEAATAEHEQMDAAVTTVTLSPQTPTMPPNDALPVPSPSTESEDEAYDAALVLIEMARGQRQASGPSRPGPKKARFQHPPRRLKSRSWARSRSVRQTSQPALPRPAPYRCASRVTKQ